MAAFVSIFLTAAQSVLQLFLVMAVGVFLQRRMRLLGFQLRKELSTIVFSLALPCLLVTKIAYSIDLGNMSVLFVVPAFTVMHVAAAYALSAVGARFLGAHFSLAFHQGHYTASTILGNSGTIPFIISAAVARMHPWTAEQSSEQEAATVALSIGYVSLYTSANRALNSFGLAMSLGEKAVLTMTSDYGYGEAGAGSDIPPNADLRFEVELLRIGSVWAPGAQGSSGSICSSCVLQ
jgi:predicted permease